MHYVKIPHYQYEALKRIANWRGVEINSIVEEAVFWYLNLMGHKIGALDIDAEFMTDVYDQIADEIAQKVVEKLERKGS